MRVAPTPDDSEPWEFDLSIKDSVIKISCYTESAKAQGDYRFRAEFVVRTAVTLFGFQNAFGVSFDLDTMIDANGELHLVGTQNAFLIPLCTAYDASANFSGAFSLINSDHNLVMALGDLVDAVKNTSDAPINLARAIDGIRKMIAPGEPIEEQWRIMRERLRIDRAYLQPITDISRDPRHGRRKSFTADQIHEIFIRCWTIMNRYLEYLKANRSELPEHKFPLLTG
jgi:hypothetical protein